MQISRNKSYKKGLIYRWCTNIPEDNNLYKTTYNSMNAIDERLGGTGKLGYAKRRERGIRIVVTKKKSS